MKLFPTDVYLLGLKGGAECITLFILQSMKLILFLLMCLFCSVFSYAQRGKILQASSYYTSGKLDQAKKLVDEGMAHEACADYSKGYFMKGIIYQAIHESLSADYRKLDKNALEVAWESYKQLLRLDKKRKYDRRLEVYFKNLVIDYTDLGVERYNEGKYEEALLAFQRVLELDTSRVITKGKSSRVDTLMVFNAAISAQKAGDWGVSERYYKEALKYDYKPERCYAMLGYVLMRQEKTDEAVECLKRGYDLFPHNSYMLTELINYYLESDSPEKADDYLNAAIKADSGNFLYYRTKGILYEKLSQPGWALNAYQKALELNPEDFIAQYNVANIKLAEVIRFRRKVQSVVDVNLYKKEMEKLYRGYKEVIPYFERALELNPEDRNSMLILRGLYFNLRNEDGQYQRLYEEMKAKVEQTE